MARYVPKVLICDTDPRNPVYHALGVPTEAQLANRQSVAKCGATSSPMYQARIRRDHADLFARPCRRCFFADAP